ncbi:peptidase C14 [Cladochytrium replicatum]|nr:peptidase C14 [Cladochytrium replicatum]
MAEHQIVVNDPSLFKKYQDTAPEITGKRRALVMGINYTGTSYELSGCINDAKNAKAFIAKHGYEDTMTLTDDQENPEMRPTAANIIKGMVWLVADAKPGDAFFLHYSGHGAYVKDSTGDEVDGSDETICPVDFKEAGMIADDDMHAILLLNLPEGCSFFSVFDCCHSGSILDLPYTAKLDGELELQVIDNNNATKVDSIRTDTIAHLEEAKKRLGEEAKRADTPAEKSAYDNATDAFVVQFSGCLDSQTSADTQIDGKASGALSWALLKALEETADISYLKLLRRARELLQGGGYTQLPQLSTGFPISLDIPFCI